MAKKPQREEIGVLVRPAPFLYLRNGSGTHWRLEVDDGRVAHLIGWEVRVCGKQVGGTIQVESITQA